MEKIVEYNKVICDPYTIAYYCIIVFFVFITIVACSCSLKLFYPKLELGSCAEILTAVIALFACFVTYNEYISTKDTKQAQVLSEYNKRYSEDPNIVKVVKYLNYIHESGTINNPYREKPSNYEVEMFMRFFEELELQIIKKRLSEKDVCNLFTYYAHFLSLPESEELRSLLGVTKEDYEKNWNGFKTITDSHNRYNNKKEYK